MEISVENQFRYEFLHKPGTKTFEETIVHFSDDTWNQTWELSYPEETQKFWFQVLAQVKECNGEKHHRI